jgi:hypothetical protein
MYTPLKRVTSVQDYMSPLPFDEPKVERTYGENFQVENTLQHSNSLRIASSGIEWQWH